MSRLLQNPSLHCLALALWLLPAAAGAQTTPAPAATPAAPAPAVPVTETQRSLLPQTLQLPDLQDIKLPMPRTVRAANAVLGLARQRLALVVGNGSIGNGVALATASRDAQAVAAALRACGFVVMVREDLGADDLRANLKEFQGRLQPGGVGLLYFTGLAAQVEGRNYVLPRGLPLQGATDLPAQIRSAAVPLQEIVDAVQGTADSPRYLVVDAAIAHPALAGLAKPGLAEQAVPQGVMGLFASAPGAAAPLAEPFALPLPAPTDPRQIAASAFGREFVRSLVTPRLSGPDILRLTRGAMLDISAGKQVPVIVGDSAEKDEFAEPNLLDALFPRSPEDLAREALKQAARGVGGGDVPVSAVAGSPARTSPSVVEKEDGPSNSRSTRDPQPPSGTSTAVNAATSAAANAATAAAVVAVGAAVAQASTTAAVAGSAVGLAGSVASAVLGSSGSSGGAPARDATANQLMKPTAVTRAAGEGAPAAAPTAAPATAAAATAVPAAVAAPVAAPVAEAVLPPAVPRDAVPPGFSTATSGAEAGAGTANAALPVGLASQLLQQAAQQSDERTQRQQNGGERPAYVPRVNPFGYAEGDTFLYRVLDTWKGEELGSMVQSIDEVLDGGDLVGNGHQLTLDPQGRIKQVRHPDGSSSQFQPYQGLWWANAKRGESRRVEFTEMFQRADRSRGQIEWKGSLSVGRPRKIQLPAGEFEVLPIEGSGWFYETMRNGRQSSGQWSRTTWYAPKLGHPVAIDIEESNAVGKLQRRERIELTGAQTARSAP